MEDLSGCSKQTTKNKKKTRTNRLRLHSSSALLGVVLFLVSFFFPYIIPRRPRPPVGQDGPLATSRARRQTTMA